MDKISQPYSQRALSDNVIIKSVIRPQVTLFWNVNYSILAWYNFYLCYLIKISHPAKTIYSAVYWVPMNLPYEEANRLLVFAFTLSATCNFIILADCSTMHMVHPHILQKQRKLKKLNDWYSHSSFSLNIVHSTEK